MGDGLERRCLIFSTLATLVLETPSILACGSTSANAQWHHWTQFRPLFSGSCLASRPPLLASVARPYARQWRARCVLWSSRFASDSHRSLSKPGGEVAYSSVVATQIYILEDETPPWPSSSLSASIFFKSHPIFFVHSVLLVELYNPHSFLATRLVRYGIAKLTCFYS
ncbi:hypothetical protein F5B18DRAFT_91110 [Nemania serpens]|nr:hypothetical protein F5B18DRAFT_91110 [Nemania serpens]